MTMTETTFDDYAYWVDFLRGRQHRKVSNNTYARLEPNGSIVIKYHATDILTFRLNRDVVYNSGGWLTYTTKERLNSFGAHLIRISQTKGRWYVYRNGSWDEPISDFYDGLTVNHGQLVTGAIHAEDPDKKIKRQIDRYVKLYTDEKLAELIERAREHGTAGDCWYCALREQGSDVPMGENMPTLYPDGVVRHQPNYEHLLDYIEEGYTMIHLAYNAVEAAGYRNPAVILSYAGDSTRRAIRRYLRQRLATNTAGAAGGPKPIATGF